MTYSATCRNNHTFDPESTLMKLKSSMDEDWAELGADPNNLPDDAFMSITLLCPVCKVRVHHDGKPEKPAT